MKIVCLVFISHAASPSFRTPQACVAFSGRSCFPGMARKFADSGNSNKNYKQFSLKDRSKSNVSRNHLCLCIKNPGPPEDLRADCDNLQDTCPTDTTAKESVFINGFPCKNPDSIMAEDFKSSQLEHPGDTDNFRHSAQTIVTAAEFPGLNTLGLSIARTDLDVDGLVMPHSHPRATEMLFVSQGVIIAGFIDTENTLFQKIISAGDVFVFPRGLLHFVLNDGYEAAVVFSVLNSQNPGVVKIADAMFEAYQQMINNKLVRKMKSISFLKAYSFENLTLAGFN
ncbi:hypothetical protein Tsubulata_017167 [Turnera subulata]|uniref:Germin-like protein n=1 Tax=Turnera subulata TaxID=218843 RepID=A0A9Q0FDW4_9ROSI|nr:hypothetical protein Tsubulata_017167 [Turnera subulata]